MEAEPKALTKTNIYTEIIAGNNALDNEEVPETGRIIVVTPDVYVLMKQCKDITMETDIGNELRIKGVIAMIDGAMVIKVPANRLPKNFGFMVSHLEERQLSEALQKAVEALPFNLGEIIRCRYQEGKSVRETGEVMGLTTSKVRCMEFKALQELRYSGRLVAFLPEWLEAEAYRHNGIREFKRTWESSTERVALKLL